jgi:arylsulfatase A-like enzyme
VSGAGVEVSGRRHDGLVELTDIAPTLLESAGLDIPERMQGRSLLPLFSDPVNHESVPANHESVRAHRDSVRCEYYRALPPVKDGMVGSYATMYRDQRYKLCVYHGHDFGELYDLECDPEEFENLWESEPHRDVRMDLMKRSFDATALAVDYGPKQTTMF